MTSVAIIQARFNSSRLPGKVLADIAGRPMLQRVLERVRAAPGVDQVVVATTQHQSDNVISDWCGAHGIAVYRGSDEDVLTRFWECLQRYPSDYVIRVTADDPLKDPILIARALALCASAPEVDYASNTLQPSYPEGLDVEVLKYRALERAAREATLPSEREHVTPYVWKHPDRFVLRDFAMRPNLSHWRLTVDKPNDLILMRAIFTHFRDQPLIDCEKVIGWLSENPHLLDYNAGTMRNEGYYKSLLLEEGL